MNASRSTYFTVDFLSFTGWHDDPGRWWHILRTWDFAEGLEFQGTSNRGYAERHSNKMGFNFYCSPYVLDHGNHVNFEFSGMALRHFGAERVLTFLSGLMTAGYTIKIKRCDFAFDHQMFQAADVLAEIEAGNVKTHCHRDKFKRTGGLAEFVETDCTVYVGAPSSDRRLRCYQKQMEDHPVFAGEVFNRVELILRADNAHYAMVYLLNADDYKKQAEFAAGLLRGFFDVLTDWWVALFSVAPIKAYVKQIQSSVERTAKWLHTQVLPALATYIKAVAVEGLEDFYLRSLYRDGLERMRDKHWAIVKAFDPDLMNRYSPIHF